MSAVDTDAVMALWQRLPADDREARAALGRHYAERVVVNGTELRLDDLVARARTLQSAFADLTHELLEHVEADDRVVIAFLLRGRHVGPWPTPDGLVAASGRRFAVRTIDVLRVADGRITGITVVSDELGLLRDLGGSAPSAT